MVQCLRPEMTNGALFLLARKPDLHLAPPLMQKDSFWMGGSLINLPLRLKVHITTYNNRLLVA